MSIQRQLVRILGWFPEQSISFSEFRSGIEGFSRTECPFKGSWFGFGGGFPNGVSPLQSFVRDLVAFPERNVHSKAVGSGFGVASRTEYLLFRVPFGFGGDFPNKVSPPQSFVRELRAFPERNVHSKAVGSGLGVVSRTEYLLFRVSFGN